MGDGGTVPCDLAGYAWAAVYWNLCWK